jgi:hypothetical protein
MNKHQKMLPKLAAFLHKAYLIWPGLSSYPAVKIAAKNATITNKIKKSDMLCIASLVQQFHFIIA